MQRILTWVSLQAGLIFAPFLACSAQEFSNLGVAKYVVDQSGEPRGPSRSPFHPSAAKTILEWVLQAGETQDILNLSETDFAKLRSDFASIRPAATGVARLSRLRRVDEFDAPYSSLLASHFDDSKLILRQLIVFEGLSALRRPIFQKFVGLSRSDQEALTEELAPVWEQATGLHRANFEKTDVNQAALGLELLATQADLIVIRSLSPSSLARVLLESQRSG
ncbi:MAG: hypothetical protein AAF802_30930 [Planctomycetota bacterium]